MHKAENKIGSIVEYITEEKVFKLEVKTDENSCGQCNKCFFEHIDCRFIMCKAEQREDCTEVYFVEIKE